jgi:MYXO-CTERM domain-containing protein
MSRFLRDWCKLGALVLCLAWTSPLRADLITPDSIPSPPPVSPASDGKLAPGGWVTDQYVGVGLNFPYRMTGVDTGLSTALVQVDGVKVWTGASAVDAGILGGVSFSAGVRAELVVPGTQTPATADSLRLEVVASGGAGLASAVVQGYDARGDLLLSQRTSISEGPGGTWVTLSAPGLHSFQVTAFPGLVPASASGNTPFTWGVAAVDVQTAPEPASLAHASLALLGLAGWAWRRRRFPSAAGNQAGLAGRTTPDGCPGRPAHSL